MLPPLEEKPLHPSSVDFIDSAGNGKGDRASWKAIVSNL
jgi:hypothetical protein